MAGVATASVRRIARRAGISSGTLTHHFPSIDDLLTAVLRAEQTAFVERRGAMLARRASALEGILGIGPHLFADDAAVREYWTLWLDHWARSAHDTELARWQSDDYAAWRRLLADLISEGIAAGEFVAVDAERVAAELVAFIDGLALQAFFRVDGFDPAAAQTMFRDAVRSWLPLPSGLRDPLVCREP